MLQGWVTQDHFFLVDGEPFSKGNHFFHLTALIGQDAGVRTPSCWDEGLLQLGS